MLLAVATSCNQNEVYDGNSSTRLGSDGVLEVNITNTLHVPSTVSFVRATMFRSLLDELLDSDEFCIEELFGDTEFCCCGKVGGALNKFEEITVGEAPFNSGFTMQLRNDIPDAFLCPATELEFLGNLTISNRDARISWWHILGLDGYCAVGEWIGRFSSSMRFVFSDRDVTISGHQPGLNVHQNFNLSLTRGWNIVYLTETHNSTNWSTQHPPGRNFIWSMPAFWSPD